MNEIIICIDYNVNRMPLVLGWHITSLEAYGKETNNNARIPPKLIYVLSKTWLSVSFGNHTSVEHDEPTTQRQSCDINAIRALLDGQDDMELLR